MATPPKATCTMASACSVDVGTTWHSLQRTERATPPPERCAWWAPTARSVVSVSPRVPAGGAGFSAEPWQELHVIAPTSTVPSTWVATLTVEEV